MPTMMLQRARKRTERRPCDADLSSRAPDDREHGLSPDDQTCRSCSSRSIHETDDGERGWATLSSMDSGSSAGVIAPSCPSGAFVGRDVELATVLRLVGSERLVTVV